MSQGRFTLADVLDMLKQCAPGFHHRVSHHSLLVFYGNNVAELPKGPGVAMPAPRRVHVHDRVIRALVSQLGIDVACASKHFPGLWK